jgi:hypothetical protein
VVTVAVRAIRDGYILVAAGHADRKRWWRHFREPAVAQVRYRGTWHSATGQVTPPAPLLWRPTGIAFPVRRWTTPSWSNSPAPVCRRNRNICGATACGPAGSPSSPPVSSSASASPRPSEHSPHRRQPPLWQRGQPVPVIVAIGAAGGLLMAGITSAITGDGLRRLLDAPRRHPSRRARRDRRRRARALLGPGRVGPRRQGQRTSLGFTPGPPPRMQPLCRRRTEAMDHLRQARPHPARPQHAGHRRAADARRDQDRRVCSGHPGGRPDHLGCGTGHVAVFLDYPSSAIADRLIAAGFPGQRLHHIGIPTVAASSRAG